MVHKNVLFIVHDVYMDYNEFPLGLGYLAAMLEKNNYTVEVYSMDVFHYSNEQLAQKLTKNDYDVIGVGFLAARFNETVSSLCNVINKHKKNALFVLGGHGPSPIPEYMLLKTKADVVAIGEAEETILDIVECALGNKKLSSVKGIAYREKEKVFINERRKPIKNLDSIPFPAWHLFPMDHYTTCFYLKGMDENDKLLSVISSRGCSNRCTFCYRMEKGLRLRNLQNLIDELKELNTTYGVTTIHFSDELFIVSKKRAFEFERLLKENDLKIKYSANARVDNLDDELMSSLKRSGCISLNIGFESSSQKVLDVMKKRTTVEQNIKALDLCEKHKMRSGLNFIWGFPYDTKEALFENMRLIKKYNQYLQVRTIRPVTPYPGCELYYYAIDKGLISGPDDFFNNFKNSDLMTVNLTEYPTEQCYDWLLEVNEELILDHYKHVGGDLEIANGFISQLKDLYDGKDVKYRGARHYKK